MFKYLSVNFKFSGKNKGLSVFVNAADNPARRWRRFSRHPPLIRRLINGYNNGV
jgi:hypothetical protein